MEVREFMDETAELPEVSPDQVTIEEELAPEPVRPPPKSYKPKIIRDCGCG